MRAAIDTLNGAASPIYTVASLHAKLAGNPTAWYGRTVRVRGTVYSLNSATCPSGSDWCGIVLMDPNSSGPLVPWLEPGPASALPRLLRHIPLLSPLAPQPQALHWNAPATYRVQLQPSTHCLVTSCYQGLLLDAASLIAAQPAQPVLPARPSVLHAGAARDDWP